MIYMIITLLVIISFAQVYATDSKTSKFDAIYERALKVSDQNDFVTAMDILDSALLIDPNNYNGQYLKGQILVQIAENSKAIDIFQKLNKQAPDKGDPIVEIAMIYNTLQKYDSALKYIDLSLKIDPKNAIFNNNKGFILFNKGDFKAAIVSYSKAIGYDNKNYLFFNNRGLSKYSLEDYKGALEDMNYAEKIASVQDPLIYYYRGMTHLKLKNDAAACKDFEEAAKLGEKEAEAAIAEYCNKSTPKKK